MHLISFISFQSWDYLIATATTASTYVKSFITENKVQLILHRQCHGCWWPGFLRHKVINSHDIDLIWMEHFGFSTIIVKYSTTNTILGSELCIKIKKPVGGIWHSERHFVDISKHIQVSLYFASGHPWNHKAHQVGNQKAHFLKFVVFCV